jgi:SAM-dependent methyltransferase
MERCYNIYNENKPKHIDTLTLICLDKFKNELTLSPKADGTYTEIRNKINVFQCEYIDKYNLYLIFDCKKFHIKHMNTLINRINWIRSLHPTASKMNIPKITNIDQLDQLIIDDTKLIQEYLNTTQDKIKWYPKITFNINITHIQLLKILDTNIDNILSYKTDGWIITNTKQNKTIEVYKYKPKDELTIDILFNHNKWYSTEKELTNIKMDFVPEDNTIWRCYWESDIWIPREIRTDKKKPNYQWLIDELEETHKNYTSASNLILNLNDCYYSHSYEKNKILDNSSIEYLNTQRNIFTQNINTLLINNQTVKNILDIGCGKGYLLNIVQQKYNITGIDIDPFNIYKLKQKYNNKNYNWIWEDINKYEFKKTVFDFVILNNTIHTINNINKFIQDLSNAINTDAILYLHFLDRDKLSETQFDFITFESIYNGIYKYKFDLPWRENTLIEQIVSYKCINEILIKNNFVLDYEYVPQNNINGFYGEYLLCHRYLVYKKL